MAVCRKSRSRKGMCQSIIDIEPAMAPLGKDFGVVLMKARSEAAHIFREAEKSKKNNEDMAKNGKRETNSRSKAAAWAWYQHGGGGAASTSPGPEYLRNRASISSKRESRFKAEAQKSHSFSGDLSEPGISWNPSRASLFDSYEITAVANELDRALSGLVPHPIHSDNFRKPKRLSKIFPVCRSTEIIESATKKYEDVRKEAYILNSASKKPVFNALNRLSVSDSDAVEHFHHHEHDHYHHYYHHIHHHAQGKSDSSFFLNRDFKSLPLE